MSHKFIIGQQVVLTIKGGHKEIGTVVPSETGRTSFGVWVYSPSKRYASDYAIHNVKAFIEIKLME